MVCHLDYNLLDDYSFISDECDVSLLQLLNLDLVGFNLEVSFPLIQMYAL